MGPQCFVSLRSDGSLGLAALPSRYSERGARRLVPIHLWLPSTIGTPSIIVAYLLRSQSASRHGLRRDVARAFISSAVTGEPKPISTGDYCKHLAMY